MNSKPIKRNIVGEDENTESFIKVSGLNRHICEFLLSFGLQSGEVTDFINPNEDNLHDPYEMKGMKEVVDRLKVAASNGETVVVYGDYDADGICASAILSLYLTNLGVNVYTHIPMRKDGYGLKLESLERIIDECCPDLILTCDCGISAIEEVTQVLDLGVDIIVTDHHEVGAGLPDCPIINAKQPECNYPFKQLCGAGVALKIVQAMGGISEARNYYDIAAIATIADLVPLVGENRLIVQLGLQAMRRSQNIGIKALLDSQKVIQPTAGDISFKLVPRINAAGRMGDAYRSFRLFIEKDITVINELIAEIEQDNIKRRAICDEIYTAAIEKIKTEGYIFDRAIVIYSDAWDKGVVGIVAARITEDFCRPCMIIIKTGDICKGTARSIEGINIYELLSACSDCLIEYGGHNQAAGFSIQEDKIAEFRQQLNRILESYEKDLFLPKYYYDLGMGAEELDLQFVTDLEKLEPFGNGFNRPTIMLDAEKLVLGQTRSGYYTVAIPNGQLISFNPCNVNFLVGNEKKYLFIEPELNTFAGQQSVRGIIKSVLPEKLYINDEVSEANKVFALKNVINEDKKTEFFDIKDLKAIIGDKIYGTLVIASDRSEYERNMEILKELPIHEFFGLSSLNNISRVIVSPCYIDMFSYAYNKIIYLSSPPDLALLPKYKRYDGKILVAKDKGDYSALTTLSLLREDFATCFDLFRNANGKQYASPYACFKSFKGQNNVSYNQFVFCLCVFEELGILKVDYKEFSICLQNGVKASLDNSKIYSFVKNLVKKHG